MRIKQINADYESPEFQATDRKGNIVKNMIGRQELVKYINELRYTTETIEVEQDGILLIDTIYLN